MSLIEKARDIIAKGEKAIEGPWFSQGTTVGHAIPRLTVRYDDNGRLHESVEAEAEKLADTGSDNDAAYIAAANPDALLPVLRLLVEMAEKLQEHADFNPEIDPAEGDCDPWIRIAAHGKKMARALLDKLRSES